MFGGKIFFAVILAASIAAPALAEAPATAATQAEFNGGDWSTPAKAVGSFYIALARGEAVGLTQSVAWKNADDGRIIAGMMVWTGGDKKLREVYTAMRDAFPKDVQVEEHVKKNVAILDQRDLSRKQEIARTMQAIREGEVKVEGESATVKPKGRDVIKLKKADGQWVIVQETLEPPYNAISDETRAMMAKMAADAQKLRAARTAAYDKYISDLRIKTYPSGEIAIKAREIVELDIGRKLAEEK
jgi:hypothetical protein